jgi:ubiquinone/menaquinone biosynthesis C-methylase UbiE
MMVDMDRDALDIASMPRGGPDASWLDRRLRTDRLEYLDRDDVAELKRKVVESLDRTGRRRVLGNYELCARAVLDEVTDTDSPRILELGCGLGGLSRKLLEYHPTAHVTVSDIDPEFVDTVNASDLGSHPRATIREMDATAIEAADGYYDLAVFALSLHHLPPEQAVRVFAEGTRVAKKLLIIDLRRWPAPLQLGLLAVALPFTGVVPPLHDAVISSLRAYSPSALRALAAHADPAITVEFRSRPRGATSLVAARRAPTG